MTTAIDQKSYLQKYLGGPSGDKKKKKKKAVKGKGFKIIDDDLDLSKLRPLDGDELDILNQGEDAPQIAGIIDERPEELRKLDAFQNSSKWRVINQDDGFNSKLRVEEVKLSKKEVEKENEIVFGKMYSDSEDEQKQDKKEDSDASPPRKNDKKKDKHMRDSDFSPPRRTKTDNAKSSKNYDSDVSPPRKSSKSDRNTNKNNTDSDTSPPRRKNETENSKTRNKNDSDQSPTSKHSKSATSKRSRDDRRDNKESHHNDSDVSPPRKKDDKQIRNRVRKPSRWGDFRDDESNQRTDSLTDRRDKRKKSPCTTDNKNKYDSDVSPPRKSRRDSPKRNKSQESDESPPRKRKLSPEKQNNHNKYGDRSSPKRSKVKKYKDQSKKLYESKTGYSDLTNRQEMKRNDTQRNRKNDSDSDISLPRQERSKYDIKMKDRNKRQDSDSDVSPPRKERNKRKDSSDFDMSPPRNERNKHGKRNTNKRQDSDSDQSPPRKERNRHDKRNTNKRQDSDSDLSPPRKERNRHDKRNTNKRQDSDSDPSPPRKERNKHDTRNRNKRQDSDSDQSPPRKERNRHDKRNTNKRQDSDSDLSPPRKESGKIQKDSWRNSDEPPPSNKRMDRTLEGKKAGLQDAGQLKQENEAFRRREDDVFRNMTDEMSGRNAQIVSRKGKRETSEERQKQKEKAERQKVLDEKYKQWSRGLKQIESQQAAVQDFIHEASKPLARYKDDRDLESKLKDVEREGDPMLQYMREKKRERGELGPEKPMYKGSFPPNRFNIRPGYRWDGVDRSNGYEKKYFEQQSKKKAQQEELYKWSTEDL